jgi:dienelactone hydrolase
MKVAVILLLAPWPAGRAAAAQGDQSHSPQSAGHKREESASVAPLPLAGTEPLLWTGDIASRLVEGVDHFLLGETERSVLRRERLWNRDTSSAEKYAASIEPQRKRLAHILGVRDPRVPFERLQLVAGVAQPQVFQARDYQVCAVRWPAFGDIHGEGLLLTPAGKILADVVAIPDADQAPEMLAGLAEGVPAESQFARRLCESGCRVLVPTLVSRATAHGKLANREYLYRSAYELGRHPIGYEVEKVLAAVDWFSRESGGRPAMIGVMGWGEGGMLALYAGALDPRIRSVCVSGYFGSRQDLWQEPLYRNVFGLLEQFGDAELATMIVPRRLVIEAARGPELVVPPGTGGGPGRLTTPRVDEVRREIGRARQLLRGLDPPPRIELVASGDGRGAYGSEQALAAFIGGLAPAGTPAAAGGTRSEASRAAAAPGGLPAGGAGPPPPFGTSQEIEARQARQVHELDRHNQWLLGESPYVRQEFFNRLDTSSPEKFAASAAWYREFFYNEVIGRFDERLLPPHPRTRKSYEGQKWTGYEVVLDVFPDVIAYGVLLVPKDIKPGEQRPVVVCQHGLEGRPADVFLGDHPAYHDFAARLADRGLVTFAPQNLYLFGDRFRTLQRKANPLKKTLYSIIVPQHQQIVDWLGGLPFVDRRRIAFYGLSYGGKTAMRVPPLVAGYCLSICSGDFNDWVWKNASSRSPYSYVRTGEYEIFEFDLGSTLNYAEMAALIAPRPFMVERGHFDGVAPDETVGYEFAKVRFLYEARLKLADRCRIEWFVGPHTIHGRGTFDFLAEHLAWPQGRP